MSTKYDDASWHYGGDFPEDLPDEAGATHIAKFLAWALMRGFAGPEFTDKHLKKKLVPLLDRQITPGQFFLEALDGKFIDFELSAEGNAFAAAYYAPLQLYLQDYDEILSAGLPSMYHVEDSWTNFDAFKSRIDQRFEEWRRGALPAPAPQG